MKYHLVIQGQLTISDEEEKGFEGTKYVIQRGGVHQDNKGFDDAMREALRELKDCCRMVTISLTEDR